VVRQHSILPPSLGTPCPVDSGNPVFDSLAKAPTHEKRTIARNFFQELSLQKDSFVGFSPSKELGDDLISGSYASPLPVTLSKWHQGFSPMAFVVRSVQDLAKQREQRDLTSHYNNLLQISNSKCKKLESGLPTVLTSLPCVLNVHAIKFQRANAQKIFNKRSQTIAEQR
jgi:hypothetical protein